MPNGQVHFGHVTIIGRLLQLGWATEGLVGTDPRTSRSGRSSRIDERIRGNSLERLLRHFLLFFLGAATSPVSASTASIASATRRSSRPTRWAATPLVPTGAWSKACVPATTRCSKRELTSVPARDLLGAKTAYTEIERSLAISRFAALLAKLHRDGPRVVCFEQDRNWIDRTRDALAKRVSSAWWPSPTCLSASAARGTGVGAPRRHRDSRDPTDRQGTARSNPASWFRQPIARPTSLKACFES